MLKVADYYPATGRRSSPVVDLYIIDNGQRTNFTSYEVSGKRDARLIAAQFGHQPWNF